MDLPRDRALPRHRRASAAADVAEIRACWSRICTTSTRSTARSAACASRASTSRWYTKGLAGSAAFRHAMNQLETAQSSSRRSTNFLGELASRDSAAAYLTCEETRGMMMNENEMARCRAQGASTAISRIWTARKRAGVYDMVINCVEKPLLESVLHQCAGQPDRTRPSARHQPQHAAQENEGSRDQRLGCGREV